MLHGILLAGGSGTRFWPRSREARPKPFLPIGGDRPLLAGTAERLRSLIPPSRIHVVTHRRLAPLVRRLLPDLPASNVLGEPASRNTAASIGFAAIHLLREDADAVLAVLPSDHRVDPASAFRAALRAGTATAGEGRLVLFGVRPDRPAIGYGYIRRGRRCGSAGRFPLFEVEGFREKPNRGTAVRYVRAGKYLWNSGVFLWRADAILEEIRRFLPPLARGLRRIAGAGRRGAARRIASVFRGLPSVSIDRGVLEKSRRLRCLVPAFRWSDLGAWPSLREVLDTDPRGNVLDAPRGTRLLAIDAEDCVVHAERPGLVALLGVRGVVVTQTDDALLVCPADRAEEVRRIVEAISRRRWRRFL